MPVTVPRPRGQDQPPRRPAGHQNPAAPTQPEFRLRGIGTGVGITKPNFPLSARYICVVRATKSPDSSWWVETLALVDQSTNPFVRSLNSSCIGRVMNL